MNFKWALDDCKAVDRQQATRSQIILKADGSEINLSWQQKLLTIRVWVEWSVVIWLERGADFLKVGASRFSLAPRALHHHHKYNSC